MKLRRLFWALVGCLVVVSVPGAALADELDDRLGRSSQAEFSGDQEIRCVTPDEELSQVVTVVQANGRLEVRGPSMTVVVDGREVSSHAIGGATTAVVVPTASPAQRDDRYEVVIAGQSVELGRTVEVIEIHEGDLVRMVYAFDTVDRRRAARRVAQRRRDHLLRDPLHEFHCRRPLRAPGR